MPHLAGIFQISLRKRFAVWSVTLATAGPKRQQIYGKPGERQAKDAFSLPSVSNLVFNDLSGIYGSRGL